MLTISENCFTETTDTTIKFEEKKSRIYFCNENRNKYRKIQIDGCVIQDGLRCDKLLESSSFDDLYFVELKGSDANKAIEQLEETLKIFGINAGSGQTYKKAFVVLSNSSPRADARRQCFVKNFRKYYGVQLQFPSNNYKYNLCR